MPVTTWKQKVTLILLGLIAGVVLLEGGLRMGGFILRRLNERANLRSLRGKGEMVIMCVGESTTALGGENSYPRQLEEVLKQKLPGAGIAVINKGMPGGDSYWIVESLEENLERYEPDIVIAMMGINDNETTLTYDDLAPLNIKNFLKSFRVSNLLKLLGERIGYLKPLSSPEPPEARSGTRELILEKEEIEEEERRCLEAIRADPKNPASILQLAGIYEESERFKEAEEIYQEALEVAPDNYEAWVGLLSCYQNYEKPESAEKEEAVERIFETAVAIDPDDARAYLAMGRWYGNRKRWSEEARMYRKALEVGIEGKKKMFISAKLGYSYLHLKEYRKAEEILQGLIREFPGYDRPYGALAVCYAEWGKPDRAREYFEKAFQRQPQSDLLITEINYRRLKTILQSRGIVLVCVQYPLRKVEILKLMFPDTANIFFVDNEESFKIAVKNEGYDEYFTDYFAGNFGHCTPAGNRLLAENVARVLIKEVFSQRNPPA